jgi:hypothetical protein
MPIWVSLLISAGTLMKDPDKLKLMLLAWNYNLQQVHAQAQAQAANAALSPNNSSTTTSTTVGTPVTSQSAISTANNTISNSTLTGNTLSHPASDRDRAESARELRARVARIVVAIRWKIRYCRFAFAHIYFFVHMYTCKRDLHGVSHLSNEVDPSSIFRIF